MKTEKNLKNKKIIITKKVLSEKKKNKKQQYFSKEKKNSTPTQLDIFQKYFPKNNIFQEYSTNEK